MTDNDLKRMRAALDAAQRDEELAAFDGGGVDGLVIVVWIDDIDPAAAAKFNGTVHLVSCREGVRCWKRDRVDARAIGPNGLPVHEDIRTAVAYMIEHGGGPMRGVQLRVRGARLAGLVTFDDLVEMT